MKKILFFVLAVLLILNLTAQNVGIGTSTPNTSAQLDVSSTTKGMLIPRMTDAEKNMIASPAQGLMIFNTSSNSFQFFNGSIWSNITHSGIVSGAPNRVAKFNSPWGLTPGMLTDNGTGVSLNNTATVANTSAILDIASNNKGLLIPRMLSTERTAIVSPATGLLVFDNTTNSFWFYNGTVWAEINTGGGSNNWSVLGNNIYNNNTGNVGIGISTPVARLTVDSSIMVDQSNSNDGTLNKGALLFGSEGRVGIVRSTVNGSSGRNGLSFYTNYTRRMTIDSTGQVGIGTVNPVQALHVEGNTYIFGNLGIGSSTPDYAFENLWGYNYMFYGLGIGTVPTGSYMLDVYGGPVRFQSDVRINGILNPNNHLNIGNNASVDGSLTVNNGGGVAYNPNSSTNLKIVPFTTANFHAILGPHGSAETSIALPAGFTGTPRVFVGNINVTGGTVGELNRVILVLWNCDNNSCTAKIINTDNASVDYNITWNCLAIGN